MKGYLIIMLSLIFFTVGCNANEEVLELYQIEQKGIIAYKMGEKKPFTGKVILKDEKGKLEREWNYKKGELDGFHKRYHANDKLAFEGRYKNNIEEGPFKSYYDNGQVEYEGNYKKGRLEGIFRSYYKNGQLEEEANYKNDKPEGLCKSYYDNGQLKSEGNFKMVNQKVFLKSIIPMAD